MLRHVVVLPDARLELATVLVGAVHRVVVVNNDASVAANVNYRVYTGEGLKKRKMQSWCLMLQIKCKSLMFFSKKNFIGVHDVEKNFQ